MAKLSKAELETLAERHRQVLFYGTPEMGYADSGFWTFLNYVYTKDAHGKSSKDTIKKLMGDDAEYLVTVFLYMLACDRLAIPKSRQMRMSWATTAFAVWHTMTAPYRLTIYQTKKETDAFAMVSEGSKNPTAGRMDFIIQHLPAWLADPNVVSGRGNQVGGLNFTPGRHDSQSGAGIPWYGSAIKAIPQGGDQVRQYTPSLFISDESAFQDEFASSMVALQAATTGGGKWMAVSSVQAGSSFNKMVLESKEGRSPDEIIHPTVMTGLRAFGLKFPKGLRSWQTPSKVWCLEVHYSADPAKDPARDGAEWWMDAQQGYVGGLESSGWKTEMEIDYNAGGGGPVFPFLTSKASPVFIPRPSMDEVIGSHTIYAGYDDGANAPSAFAVWSFDKDGKAYAVWELYEPCVDMGAFVAKMKRCPYWDHIKYIVCDPAITAKNQRVANGNRSVHELFSDYGIRFVPGRRDVDVPQARRMISEYWSDPVNPRAFITDACPNGQREFMDLRWDRIESESTAAKHDDPDRIRQKNNHFCDATFYLFDTRPRVWQPEAPKRDPRLTFNDLLEQAERKSRLERTRSGRAQLMRGGWR